MSRGNIVGERITGAGLSNPVLASFDQKIPALTGVLGWFEGRLEDQTLDVNGRSSSTADRRGVSSGTLTQGTAGKRPLFVPAGVNGRGVLQGISSRPDAMLWSGTLPSGAGAKWSKVLIVQVDAVVANQHLFSNGTPSTLFVNGSGIALMGINSVTRTASGPLVWGTGYHLIISSYEEDAGYAAVSGDGGAPYEGSFTPVTTTSSPVYLGVSSNILSTTGAANYKLAAMAITSTNLHAPAMADELAVIKDYARSVFKLTVSG